MREGEEEEAGTKREGERETRGAMWQEEHRLSTSLALVGPSPRWALRFLGFRQARRVGSVDVSDLLECVEEEGIIDDGRRMKKAVVVVQG